MSQPALTLEEALAASLRPQCLICGTPYPSHMPLEDDLLDDFWAIHNREKHGAVT